MSQEQYYNNRLRRESNIALSDQESNRYLNGTGSHVMSSVKRSGRLSSRQSLTGATRVSIVNTNGESSKRKSNIGLGDMMQQSVARANSRRSLIPTATPLNRANTRASSFGLGTLSQTRDPRPLRDRNYQQNIQQEILEFLFANNFEHEMKHPVSTKSLKSPTQRDFVLIFQFLYKILDPTYRFTKSIEHEVYAVLKTLKYPYLETVNRSQISAVGGQNWPVFLGILYWLVKVIQDFAPTLDIQDNVQEGIRDESLADENDYDLDDDLILRRYTMKSYDAFMNEIDDFTPFYEEMKEEYVKLHEDRQDQMKAAQQLNSEFKKNFDKISDESKGLQLLERKKSSLTDDSKKLRTYIDTLRSRKGKWADVLEKIKAEQSKITKQIETYQNEKNEIAKHIQSQGFTTNDIDRTYVERDRISRSIDETVKVKDDLIKQVQIKETITRESHDTLQETLKAYNHDLYIVAAAKPGKDYSSFQINLENLLSDDRLGSRPNDLLSTETMNVMNFVLQDLKKETRNDIHEGENDAITLQENDDDLLEKIIEKSEEVESLEGSLQRLRLDAELLGENLTKDSASYSAEIERYQNEIRELNASFTNEVRSLDQRTEDVENRLKAERQRIEDERTDFHASSHVALDVWISAKVAINECITDLGNLSSEDLRVNEHGVTELEDNPEL